MSIQENTLVFRRSLLHLVVIGSIIHQSISFLSRGHSTPLCPALPCVTLLREALVYFILHYLQYFPFFAIFCIILQRCIYSLVLETRSRRANTHLYFFENPRSQRLRVRR